MYKYLIVSIILLIVFIVTITQIIPKEAPQTINCPICGSTAVLVYKYDDKAMYRTPTGHVTIMTKNGFGLWGVYSVRGE